MCGVGTRDPCTRIISASWIPKQRVTNRNATFFGRPSLDSLQKNADEMGWKHDTPMIYRWQIWWDCFGENSQWTRILAQFIRVIPFLFIFLLESKGREEDPGSNKNLSPKKPPAIPKVGRVWYFWYMFCWSSLMTAPRPKGLEVSNMGPILSHLNHFLCLLYCQIFTIYRKK